MKQPKVKIVTRGSDAEAPVTAAQKGNLIKMDTPLDYSFMKLMGPSDLLQEKARGAAELADNEKHTNKSIKLNNNHLQDLTDLVSVVSQVIQSPADITWIDLSFNQLTRIHQSLCEFPHLHILYLHGNRVDDVTEIDKLSSVRTLRKLALHGNPMENTKNYRYYVLSKLPHLISLDMTTVTNADRSNVVRFFKGKDHHQSGKSKRTEVKDNEEEE